VERPPAQLQLPASLTTPNPVKVGSKGCTGNPS
jgi:hypothetical protein